MDAKLRALILLIQEMDRLCAGLLPLISDERQALIHLEYERIHEIAAQKDLLARELREKRDQVKEMTNEVAAAMRTQAVDSVAQLLPLLPIGPRGELAQHYLRFRAKAQEVEFRNAANRLLIEESLLSMEEVIAEIVSSDPQATYAPPGHLPPPKDPHLSRVQREV